MTTIRTATTSDAEGILTIYSPIVEETAISFELEVPTLTEMRKRITANLETHAYFVAEQSGRIAGYAYGSAFRPRKAYSNSAEVTVYVHPENYGQGIGRALYDTLLPKLTERGFHTALAGIALPNEASIALHKACGFERVGTFREVGFKFEKWHDVEWWQRDL